MLECAVAPCSDDISKGTTYSPAMMSDGLSHFRYTTVASPPKRETTLTLFSKSPTPASADKSTSNHRTGEGRPTGASLGVGATSATGGGVSEGGSATAGSPTENGDVP